PRSQQPSFVDLSSSADNEPPSAISYADTEIDAKSQTHSTMAQSVTDSRALAPPKSRRGGVIAALGALSVAGLVAAWFALGGRGVSAEPVHSGAASVREPDAPAPTLEAKSASLPSGSASDDGQAATPPDEAPPPQTEEKAEVPKQTTKPGATTKPPKETAPKETAAKQTAPQAPAKQAPSKASAKPSSGSTAKAPVSNPTPDYGF
ncbi:MAG: hypothetical protein KC492_14430, partial [Myxococcales bacterium]|nr:hypothetical protein [Myxococcales bacterium]